MSQAFEIGDFAILISLSQQQKKELICTCSLRMVYTYNRSINSSAKRKHTCMHKDIHNNFCIVCYPLYIGAVPKNDCHLHNLEPIVFRLFCQRLVNRETLG